MQCARTFPRPSASARLVNASAFKGAAFGPLSKCHPAKTASQRQPRRGVIHASRDVAQQLDDVPKTSAFKGLVYVLLAAGFAAFSFAQIAHTQDYYVQGLGVMPVTSSQYSFVRSYGTSLIPLALYSLYSSLQQTTAATAAKLNFALFVYGAGYGIPVLLGYFDKVVPPPYAIAALLLTGIAAVFPPLFSGVDIGRAFSDIQEGVRKLFEIRGTLSFFTLVTTIIFFGQGVAVYAAPERILPPDLLEGAARAAVIIFARGVSAASLAATVASAVIKDIADNKKLNERKTFVILNLGLILMSGGMLLVAYFNALEPTGLLKTSPGYFYLRVGVSTFNILVLIANIFLGAK